MKPITFADLQEAKEAIAKHQAALEELDACRRLLIAVYDKLHTGDLPSDLHNTMEEYVEAIRSMYSERPK
ncbi:hypothetical protein ACF8C6_09000 [Pseudomonas sp. zbq_18]|uniref:hypothetical protein n=1 Tax=Pseudomonas sp. zbq_18 TaxID=3367251 RepID=UPI00370B1AD1